MTVTRFAPSPTGLLHVGNLRTALFNWLVARKAGGEFILRFDDTDPERSKPEYVEAIRADLDWLGLGWDREEFQSKRLDRYTEAADRLREMGRLYEAFETPSELDLKRKKLLNMGRPPVYDRAALELSEEEKARLRAERPSHWRFLLDHERVEWQDGILGPVSIDAGSVSDPVLIRGDGQVLYTLASVVDDMEMGITDVVRGADHVTNTATQIQIIRALGGEPPRFAHHSLLTGPEGEALSKRLGSLSIRQLREAGIEPMALLSLLARLGSSKPVELFASLDEMAENFELGDFGAAPTRFNPADLAPLTARHLASLPYEAVAERLREAGIPDEIAPAFWQVIRENITRFDEVRDWWQMLSEGAAPLIDEADREFIAEALALLPPPPYDAESWKSWTGAVKEKTGRKGKALFMPLRKALTGRDHGPDMAALMPLMQHVGALEGQGVETARSGAEGSAAKGALGGDAG